jgi:iron complex transport system substrate-binding protein
LILLACTKNEPGHTIAKSINPESPTRIISLAPSITEVLFELGQGGRVVGVTRYCDFPPGALEKSRVGGYFDVNFEAVLALKPDLVVHLVEHEDARKRLGDLGIETLAVDHSRVEGILRSITVIAQRCGVPERGEQLDRHLNDRILQIRKRYLTLAPVRPLAATKPRVLVAVGRLMDKSSGGEVFISGSDGFYDDLIALAGGDNAYREATLKFPAISREGLVRLDPDVILEMVPDLTGEADRRNLMDIWKEKFGTRAVLEGQVHVLGEDYVVVPGPRFVDLLEDMARIINRAEQ